MLKVEKSRKEFLPRVSPVAGTGSTRRTRGNEVVGDLTAVAVAEQRWDLRCSCSRTGRTLVPVRQCSVGSSAEKRRLRGEGARRAAGTRGV